MFVAACGKSTLGLAYGLSIAEAVLAPAMPSTTARAGGIFMPIINSLALASGSEPGTGYAFTVVACHAADIGTFQGAVSVQSGLAATDDSRTSWASFARQMMWTGPSSNTCSLQGSPAQGGWPCSWYRCKSRPLWTNYKGH